MKKEEENIDIQIVFDGFAQTLEEIKSELIKQNDNNQVDTQSALNTDLLNKIAETIEQAKMAIDEEDLKKFLNVVISVTTELQERANKASAEFLNQKIAELKELVKQPTSIEKRYSIDFKSSKIFIAIIFLSLGLFCSLFGNYSQYQENNRLTDNDLKYRFVKMKNGILPNEITRLENFFYYPDSAYVVNSIRKSVIDYEHRMQEQARKQEQKKQNEEIIHRLDKEIKKLNVE
ncbi:hypothetical protein [uncultured Dysgonomonas sp.]|uniref:hypothetical protein n=1 Tax=uncultured Dysgonomonas sp. TaxID=206096 RepID=UPI002804962A|nr:hypothetical protein [uncultured Dysgonomonas sp.]